MRTHEAGPEERLLRGLDTEGAREGSAPLQPALSPGFAAIGGRAMPGFNFTPEGALWFDLEGELDILPATTVTIIQFQVLPGAKCRVSGIGFGADDEIALRFLTWQLVIGGDLTRSYGQNLTNIGSVQFPAEIFVFAKDAAQVQLVLTMDWNAIQVYHIVARLTGWFYQELTT